MNRNLFIIIFYCFVGIMLMGGCDELPSADFYEYKAPAEKLREIEVLELPLAEQSRIQLQM